MLLYVWQVLHPMEIKYILLKGHGRAMAFLLFQYPRKPRGQGKWLFRCPLGFLYYYNAPSLATRLTGNYRDWTYTSKCSLALLDTRKRKAMAFNHDLSKEHI